MNAFCASENFDAFIVLRSSQPRDITAGNSSSERSSFPESDRFSLRSNDPLGVLSAFYRSFGVAAGSAAPKTRNALRRPGLPGGILHDWILYLLANA
jgi:hypothetical protein